MPTKDLFSQTDRKGLQDIFKFGGGKNTVNATDDNEIPGDEIDSQYGYIINTGGGDDTIRGSDYAGGGTMGTIVDARTTDGDLLIGGDGSDFIIGGLGDDYIFGGNEDGSDGAKGKGAVAFNTMYGDVQGNFANFSGGNDVITGGDDSTNVMYGDVLSADGSSGFIGGNDVLFGGDNAVDNALISGPYNLTVGNLMVGDGFRSGGGTLVNPEGGDDVLVSGENSNDLMIGDFGVDVDATGIDGGADTFVFGDLNGDDTIADFRTADGDKINLYDTALITFADLTGLIDDNDTDTVIDLGAFNGGTAGMNTITVLGATAATGTALVASDFDFVDWMTV